MRTRRLRPGAFSRFMKAASQCRNEHIARIIRFALATRMRRSEIASVRWKDLDVRRRRLPIPITKNGRKVYPAIGGSGQGATKALDTR